MSSFARLIKRIEQLESKINQLDRRQNNLVREAVVTEIFPEEGLMRVDAHGVVSKKVPSMERSGAIREWNPHAVGERVLLISPTGEPGRGIVLPGGFSDEFPAPHDKGGEKVTSIGGVTVTQTGSSLTIVAAGVTVEISGGGLKVTGGQVTHDGRNIGSDHKHTGVVPGGALTGEPQ